MASPLDVIGEKGETYIQLINWLSGPHSVQKERNQHPIQKENASSVVGTGGLRKGSPSSATKRVPLEVFHRIIE